MVMPVVLIVFGALSRLIPHEPNAVAMGAVALYAGARYSKWVAWLIPIGAMMLSDLVIDWGTGEAAVSISRLTIYGTYAALAVLGRVGRGAGSRPLVLVGLSLTASTVFFLTTNFAEWAAGPLKLYPHTWAGLSACYALAIPFFHNTVLADLAGVAFLFTLGSLTLPSPRFAGGRPRAARTLMIEA